MIALGLTLPLVDIILVKHICDGLIFQCPVLRSRGGGGQDYNIGNCGEMHLDMTTAGGQNLGAPGDLSGTGGSVATQARAQTLK